MVHFTVSAIKDLSVILNHFHNYPLRRKGEILIKRAVEFMSNKGFNETLNGIQEIVNLKASLNLGLSKALKRSFPSNRAH